jgi:hypothetical protein
MILVNFAEFGDSEPDLAQVFHHARTWFESSNVGFGEGETRTHYLFSFKLT